jgi:L-ascorbate metabolism protein UlaG (beta-lactamase superfamily)
MTMQIHFLRHATMVIKINGLSIMVDPMLSLAGAMDPVANAGDDRRIPLVDLPLDQAALERLLLGLDAVLVTHTHRDHWDARAVELLPKALPVICQPSDVEKITVAGFATILPVETQLGWNDLTFARTGGQHGVGEVGQRMAPVSGFIIQAPGSPTIYIAGDTIWCPEVDRALEQFWPDITILNTGSAQFLTGGPITMDAQDVAQVCRAQPGTRVVAVHLEALNHCMLSRAELRSELEALGLLERVLIPVDGETLTL